MGVPFKQSNLSAPTYYSERMSQYIGILAIIIGKSRWEKGQGCFPEQLGIRADVCSRNDYTVEPGSFQTLVCVVYVIAIVPYKLLFPNMEKKFFSCQVRVLHKQEQDFSAFYVMKNPCNVPWLRKQEAARCIISPICR